MSIVFDLRHQARHGINIGADEFEPCRPMRAVLADLIILPTIYIERDASHSAAWLAQRDRECGAQRAARRGAPSRSRPELAVVNSAICRSKKGAR